MEEEKNKLLTKQMIISFALLIGVLFFFMIFVTLIEGGTFTTSLTLGIGVIIMASIIFFAKKNYTNIAKYLLIVAPPYLILTSSILNFSTGGINTTFAYLIPFISIITYLITPILFFGMVLKKRMIISFLLILPPVVLFNYIHGLFGIKQTELVDSNEYYYILLFLFTVFYLLILSSTFFIQKKNIQYRSTILSQNKILKMDKEVVASSNEQLKSIIQENSDFEAFINNNTDAIFMLDKFGKQLYFSDQITIITGFTKQEMIGKRFTLFIPKKEIPKLLSKLKEVFLKKSISLFETFVTHKSGKVIPVEISGKLHKHNNKWVGLGTMRDITIRKEERNIVEYQSNLYSILNITSKNKPLNEIFEDILNALFKIPSLNVTKKGVVFLTNRKGGIELITPINAKKLTENCTFVEPGKCLCGKVLQTTEKLFCNSVDDEDSTHPDGHYIIPIKKEDLTLGGICLYIKEGDTKNENTIKYLEMVANVLSRKIVSEQRKEILATKNTVINNQHTLLNTVMNELQDSINYTQHLQSSLLPNQKTLNKYLQDSAVLFLPRDKVSGDFYFAHAVENYLYFGVGDCTGHGIPGAFLSSMSIEAVKTVIHSNIGEKPNLILEKLRHISKNRFKTNLFKGQTDSMDMALCCFDKNADKFYYSGGFISITLVKKNKEIITINPTKCPIGIYPFEHDYILNEIDLNKGDTIYMASDGYTDQFGKTDFSINKRPKKFMMNKFKKLISDIYLLDCTEQVAILKNTIIDWRGKLDQTDDITVFIAKH